MYTVFEDLLGVTLKNVINTDDNRLEFILEDGRSWDMYHDQECCESVYLADIIGDLQDLVGAPLLMAEVVSEYTEDEDRDQCWTFYKFATINGYVTLRWYGHSNGYYSIAVIFKEFGK